MSAYYNEHDRFAAAWLRELIRDGLIPAGDVDGRDIQLVQPADLAGYEQCHFFAGIGGWAYALQLAGWPADRPVWTGSCPCQPFSAAGKGAGFDDSRHLWPSWFRLIRECRPPVVFGEQVASADGLAWFDTVSTDLEAEAYAVGAADLAAASVGAPHLRQRLFFVADSRRGQLRNPRQSVGGSAGRDQGQGNQREWLRADSGDGGDASIVLAHSTRKQHDGGRDGGTRRRGQPSNGRVVGDTLEPGLEGHAGDGAGSLRHLGQVPQPDRPVGETGASDCAVGDTHGAGRETWRGQRVGTKARPQQSPTPGLWSDLIWLPCRDGKARPTQPGLFPLAHGVSNRVGTLRGAGNAICPQAAAQFILAAEAGLA